MGVRTHQSSSDDLFHAHFSEDTNSELGREGPNDIEGTFEVFLEEEDLEGYIAWESGCMRWDELGFRTLI